MTEASVILKRITTTYSEQEDRIRLSGESENGKLVIWLTQRLTQRLVPLLLQWLERQQPTSRRSVALFNFSQQSVQATNHTAVTALPAWLATSIDISTSSEQVLLRFKDGTGQAAHFTFGVTPLSQWLEILHEAYLQAGWPLDAWPTWMAGNAAVFKGEQRVVWH